MFVAPASRRRWWCADEGWFYRSRIRIRPRPRLQPLFQTMPSTPAFWATVTHWRPGVPASHHRRGCSWVAGRAATTPMARRRPASSPGELTSRRSPREPGTALCEGGGGAGSGCRHNAGPGTPMGRGFPLAGEGYRDYASRSWIEQPPGHGSYFVEATKSIVGMFAMNGSNRGKKPKMGIDFFR